MIKEDLKKEETAWARAAERARALYLVGIVTLIISVTLNLALKESTWFIAIFEVTCAISFGLGFCMRVWPTLVKSGRTPYGKGGMALYHAMVLVFSSIPAKYIVSEALHLPSGDFPVTLSMWALLSYPAVWLVGTAFLCVAVYALLLLCAAIAAISINPIFDAPIRLVAGFLPTNSNLHQTITSNRSSIIWKAFLHGVGAAMVSLAISVVAGWWFQTIHQPRLVRLFAYKSDYESSSAYPGVASTPFKLHDNGVVSYATYHQGDIMIHVAHVNESPKPTCSNGKQTPQSN